MGHPQIPSFIIISMKIPTTSGGLNMLNPAFSERPIRFVQILASQFHIHVFFAKKQQSTAAGRFLRDATAGTSVAGKFPTKKVMICVLKVGILATNSVIIIYIYIMHHQKSRCDSYNIIHIIHRFDFWWSPLCSRNLVPPPFIPLGLPPRWGQRSERWKRLGVWGVQLMI